MCSERPTPTSRNRGCINMHKIKPTLLHLQKGAQRLLSHFFRLPFFFTLKQLETSVTNRVYQPQEGSLAIVFSATLHHSLGFLEQIIEREKSSLSQINLRWLKVKSPVLTDSTFKSLLKFRQWLMTHVFEGCLLKE